MSIDIEEVKHIAHLSRLELTDEEAKLYSGHLSRILDYAEKLKELDVDNVPPLSHPLPMKNVYRGDRVEASLPNEDALSNAPEKDGPYFRVPRVTE